MNKSIYFISMMLLIGVNYLHAQERSEKETTGKISLETGADFVSSYIWRGLQIDPAANIQGYGDLSFGNFNIGIWASTSLSGNFLENDIYAGYSVGNLIITLTDYFVGPDGFFSFKNEETLHAAELGIQYSSSESFPLTITAGMIVYGNDKKIQSYDSSDVAVLETGNNYSSYIELMYPFSIKDTQIELVAGGTTHESYFYSSEGPAIINLGISVSKEIPFTEKFKLPVSFSVVFNPELGSIYSVFKISL